MFVRAKGLPPDDLAHVFARTRDLWAEARGRVFFITGGTGFFGMWLLESFAYINDALGLGMNAVVLTRDPGAFARKAPHLVSRADLSFITGDVRSFGYPQGRFDYIIHAATEANGRLNEEAPHEMLDAIVGGTRRVLEFAAQAGVRKLLLTSSGAAYGKQPCDMAHISEEYSGAPDPVLCGSAYGIGKLLSEHMCAVHARQHGYEVKIARCFAFVGPHLPLEGGFAMGSFIRDALEAGPIRIGGDGTPIRSYLYASDLAIWLWTILFTAPSARVYNVGSCHEYTIKQVADTVAEMASCDVLVARTVSPGLSSARYVPSVLRACLELKLSETIGFRESIRRTLEWHRSTTSLKIT